MRWEDFNEILGLHKVLVVFIGFGTGISNKYAKSSPDGVQMNNVGETDQAL